MVSSSVGRVFALVAQVLALDSVQGQSSFPGNVGADESPLEASSD
jgi:hypothetical protein